MFPKHFVTWWQIELEEEDNQGLQIFRLSTIEQRTKTWSALLSICILHISIKPFLQFSDISSTQKELQAIESSVIQKNREK